jgi:hypothetical protein
VYHHHISYLLKIDSCSASLVFEEHVNVVEEHVVGELVNVAGHAHCCRWATVVFNLLT